MSLDAFFIQIFIAEDSLDALGRDQMMDLLREPLALESHPLLLVLDLLQNVAPLIFSHLLQNHSVLGLDFLQVLFSGAEVSDVLPLVESSEAF